MPVAGRGALEGLRRHRFLFEELVKRDFKKKYKRTVFGMAWSVISPLVQFAVLTLVFSVFFARDIEHFPVYVFCGVAVFNFFSDATRGGMAAIMSNAAVITKLNVPDYLFVVSRNVQALINFGITLAVLFAFALAGGLAPSWSWLSLAYPIAVLAAFNVGAGMVLSCLFVVFRDMQYLYDIFTQLLMWVSAIFYPVASLGPWAAWVFPANPVYLSISYFRDVLIGGAVPGPWAHLALAAWAAAALAAGALMYRRYSKRFVYYL